MIDFNIKGIEEEFTLSMQQNTYIHTPFMQGNKGHKRLFSFLKMRSMRYINRIKIYVCLIAVVLCVPSVSHANDPSVPPALDGPQVVTPPAPVFKERNFIDPSVQAQNSNTNNTTNTTNTSGSQNTDLSQSSSNQSCPVPDTGGGETPDSGTPPGTQPPGSQPPGSQPPKNDAPDDTNNQNCRATCPGCCKCHAPIIQNHKAIRAHTTGEFQKHRDWIVNTWWVETMVPALMLMTNQMTTTANMQTMMIGTLFDAKHQLEMQRLFQQLTAQAHKDYHPSEGLCVLGTNVRSLAQSERKTVATYTALSERFLQRQVMSGDAVSMRGKASDKSSRLQHYRKTYCNKQDQGGGLKDFCDGSPATKRLNKDIDFTRSVESPLTLDIDFTEKGTDFTEDEEDILALSSNLFGHEVIPYLNPTIYANKDGLVREDATKYFLKFRSIAAKRSVAQDSFAALTAMRAEGSGESFPYLRKLMTEFGLQPDEITKYIGENPSYFAQMEVLTKTMFMDPQFYTDLYDKPVNVERKAAVLDALGLMQDRDIYKALLRSEATLAVLLEARLAEEQARVSEQITKASSTGGRN